LFFDGDSGENTLVIEGTVANDVFCIDDVTGFIQWKQGNNAWTQPINYSSVEHLRLNTLDGDDQVDFQMNAALLTTLYVDGGSQDGDPSGIYDGLKIAGTEANDAIVVGDYNDDLPASYTVPPNVRDVAHLPKGVVLPATLPERFKVRGIETLQIFGGPANDVVVNNVQVPAVADPRQSPPSTDPSWHGLKGIPSLLNGGGGNDVMVGGDNGNVIFGGAGQDSLFGGAGVDYLFLDHDFLDRDATNHPFQYVVDDEYFYYGGTNDGIDTIIALCTTLRDRGDGGGGHIIGSTDLSVIDWLKARFSKPTTENMDNALDEALALAYAQEFVCGVSPEKKSGVSVVSVVGPGLFDPATSTFNLRNTCDGGTADATFVYGPTGVVWTPIVGDWNGDGVDTIGLYNPIKSVFYLRDSNDSGFADATFNYGPGNSGWLPIVGDWNGDGKDTIGLYNSTTATFYLRNTNNAGYADLTFVYGPASVGWEPIVGDWNKDNQDTIGLYNSKTATFYLRNTNNAGYADATFVYGPANVGWKPIAGDWNADGTDTVGLFNPTNSTFYLRNAHDAGFADVTFPYSMVNPGCMPIVGNWEGIHALKAVDGVAAMPIAYSADVSVLTQTDLQPIVSEAIARWAAAGLDAATVARLRQVQFIISDLTSSYLSQTEMNRIYLDHDAAGYGWFIDPTPAVDEEFAVSPNGQLQAIDPRAVDQIDLLTVVEHELGHMAGLNDLDALANNLMSSELPTGVRRSA
jgi:Ca2+-binding RTX toxin-like protein